MWLMLMCLCAGCCRLVQTAAGVPVSRGGGGEKADVAWLRGRESADVVWATFSLPPDHTTSAFSLPLDQQLSSSGLH
jgi:hypothetical protein